MSAKTEEKGKKSNKEKEPTPEQIRREARRNAILKYILAAPIPQRISLRQIQKGLEKKKFFVSHETIRKDLVVIYERLESVWDTPITRQRAIELGRYDALHAQYWQEAMGIYDIEQDKWIEKPDKQAANLILNISRARRALRGLDVAQKHEITGKDGEPIQTQTTIVLNFTDKKNDGGSGG